MPEKTATAMHAVTQSCEFCPVADSNAVSGATTESLGDFFANLFATEGFPPRWECGTGWTPVLGWLHITSDFAIFAAYFAIPLVLACFLIQRKDIPFPPVFWLFVAFIALCGVGHAIEGSIFWTPWYRLSGLVKGMTAIVSWITVIAMIRITPRVLHLPSLAALNEQLLREAEVRTEVENSLRERAQELEEINEELAYISRTTVSREDRIITLKHEVNDLLDRLGEQRRYEAE